MSSWILVGFITAKPQQYLLEEHSLSVICCDPKQLLFLQDKQYIREPNLRRCSWLDPGLETVKDDLNDE